MATAQWVSFCFFRDVYILWCQVLRTLPKIFFIHCFIVFVRIYDVIILLISIMTTKTSVIISKTKEDIPEKVDFQISRKFFFYFLGTLRVILFMFTNYLGISRLAIEVFSEFLAQTNLVNIVFLIDDRITTIV